ncbi:DUF4035 domain-containing protein [Serratia sp. OS31]|uniref:phage tail assembly protein T n=1 Tax=Serratia sp. OS31 TaxID=2760844 RepID=UPI0016046A9E|nr:DUF4035 domain-containing protein [Serratia sp. OS31]MBB1583226.1 DUF4035 domain-containing protein [Serratia sp. OS31]QNO01017.1 DUF4035 domain-containing protein [Serratia phage vB_SspS_OS31]
MMKLALRLGKTLGELQQSISMSELRLWAAYDRISPIGDERGDFLAAQLVAAFHNARRDPKSQPVDLNDMVIKWGASGDGPEESLTGLESWLDEMAG